MHRLEAEPSRAISLPFDMCCWILVLLFSLLLLLSSASGYLNKPCPKYGCPLAPPIHEPFVPAPPGYTPKCAKPGLTFCESLDQYPEQLIKFLIEKGSVDFEKFLRDETNEDFNAFRQMPNYNDFGAGVDYDDGDDEQGYDYPKPKVPPSELFMQAAGRQPQPQPQPQSQSQSQMQNTAPNATNDWYAPASWHTSNMPLQSQNPTVITQQSYSYQLPSSQLHVQYQSPGFPGRMQLGGVWPRESQASAGIGYSPAYTNPLLEFAGLHTRRRAKRQSDSNAVSICPTRSQFVSPKAALNNQGNWMYVVNLEEQQQKKYSQLVKSELCISDTCDGLCSLPLGYASKCEQQYVQKRLIALEGSGDRLYTDIFWFPHGCMCQVSLEY